MPVKIFETSTGLSKYYKDYLNVFLGGLSIAMPGEVRGQYEAWKRYGWLPWKQLVEPSVYLARYGFEVTEAVDDVLKTTKGIEQDIRDDSGLGSVHIICVLTTVKTNSVTSNRWFATIPDGFK